MEALRQQRDVARAQARYDKQDNPDSAKNRCIAVVQEATQKVVGVLQFVLLSVFFNVLSCTLIFVNLAALGAMIPLYKGTAAYDIGDSIVLVCNIFFAFEIVLKMVAWGLWKVKTPPLQRLPFFWSPLNIIELIVCIVAFIVSDKIYTVARCIRLLKVSSVPLLLFFILMFCVDCYPFFWVIGPLPRLCHPCPPPSRVSLRALGQCSKKPGE